MRDKKAILALADGTVFEGYSFGAEGEAVGEVVFNTSITGYQEILTDPSYKGQMVVMTYTQIGNYGVNGEDVESRRPWVEGFIVKECCDYPSNWRAEKLGVPGARGAGAGLGVIKSLGDYLKEHNIVGIKGIDTRALTKHIRDNGAMNGVISTIDLNPARLSLLTPDLIRGCRDKVKRAREHPSMAGLDLAKDVTCKEPYEWKQGLWDLEKGYSTVHRPPSTIYRVVAYDFGIKHNILRNLVNLGCDVTVVPAFTSADDVLKMDPDGIFLSNGPGDPEPVTYAIDAVRRLIGKRPIFGICLGHQLLALALGGKTYKLKFGHRGGNQPVMDLKTGKVEITCQNHGFAVDMESLKGIADITHINLNDKTVEGLEHKSLPLFSVQYHPEASPGPHDSAYLFTRFIEMIEKGRALQVALP